MMKMMAMAAVFYGILAQAPGADPLDAYVAWSRGELKAAGLTRKTTDDGSVYWTGVPLVPKNREEAARMMRAVHGPETKTADDVLDALLERKNPPLSRLDLADVVQHLVDARLADLHVPVMLIWGRDDGILPLAY